MIGATPVSRCSLIKPLSRRGVATTASDDHLAAQLVDRLAKLGNPAIQHFKLGRELAKSVDQFGVSLFHEGAEFIAAPLTDSLDSLGVRKPSPAATEKDERAIPGTPRPPYLVRCAAAVSGRVDLAAGIRGGPGGLPKAKTWGGHGSKRADENREELLDEHERGDPPPSRWA
jgi:hypothetical protein